MQYEEVSDAQEKARQQIDSMQQEVRFTCPRAQGAKISLGVLTAAYRSLLVRVGGQYDATVRRLQEQVRVQADELDVAREMVRAAPPRS